MAGSNVEWKPSQELLGQYEAYVQHRTTQKAAADALEIHPNTIRKHFKKIERRIYDDLAANVSRIKAGQTETLRFVAMEAMAAWHDSKGEKVVVHERDTKDGVYRETTTSQSSGNASYLTSALKALEDIRKIWGAESPKQIEVETTAAETDPSKRLEKISERMKSLVPIEVSAIVSGSDNGEEILEAEAKELSPVGSGDRREDPPEE